MSNIDFSLLYSSRWIFLSKNQNLFRHNLIFDDLSYDFFNFSSFRLLKRRQIPYRTGKDLPVE